MEQLLSENLKYAEGTFLKKLEEGHFDVGLFNQIVGELMVRHSKPEPIDRTIVERFGFVSFECTRIIALHYMGDVSLRIRNIEEVDVLAALESMRWCLIAITYGKPITPDVLIRAMR